VNGRSASSDALACKLRKTFNAGLVPIENVKRFVGDASLWTACQNNRIRQCKIEKQKYAGDENDKYQYDRAQCNSARPRPKVSVTMVWSLLKPAF
jgi:hypothetical protein